MPVEGRKFCDTGRVVEVGFTETRDYWRNPRGYWGPGERREETWRDLRKEGGEHQEPDGAPCSPVRTSL